MWHYKVYFCYINKQFFLNMKGISLNIPGQKLSLVVLMQLNLELLSWLRHWQRLGLLELRWEMHFYNINKSAFKCREWQVWVHLKADKFLYRTQHLSPPFQYPSLCQWRRYVCSSNFNCICNVDFYGTLPYITLGNAYINCWATEVCISYPSVKAWLVCVPEPSNLKW